MICCSRLNIFLSMQQPRPVSYTKCSAESACVYFIAVILHYYGNGRKNTGDWCFGNECITFRDIADLYMKYSHGHTLTIITDCHSSGQWVIECAKFLDEQGVNACGHSAREKGILLKVYASCQPGQDATDLRYTTHGIALGNGNMYLYKNKTIANGQTTIGADFTELRCGMREDEECSIPSSASWLKRISYNNGTYDRAT